MTAVREAPPVFHPQRIWTVMDEDRRQRVYRLAAEQRCELDVLEAVKRDLEDRIEMREREGK